LVNRVDVQSLKGSECDIDHYLLVAKVRERLSVSKQAAQKFVTERFNLKKLNDMKAKELYQVKIWKNCQSSGRNLLLYPFMKMMIKLIVVILKEFHCNKLHTKFYPVSFCQE
jgi:hypothetical protein